MGKSDAITISRSEARRSAILDVAWTAFLEKGYGSASMSEIAERVGGSKGTLYNYFPSKQDLFLEAARRKGNALQAKLSGASQRSKDLKKGLEEGLTSLARALLDIVMSEDYLAFYRIIIAEAARLPIIGKSAYAGRETTLLAPLTTRIEEEMEAGRLRQANPAEAAEIFWDLCSASIHWRSLLALTSDLTAKEIQRLVERGVSIFLAAYGVTAEPAPLPGSHAAERSTTAAKNDR